MKKMILLLTSIIFVSACAAANVPVPKNLDNNFDFGYGNGYTRYGMPRMGGQSTGSGQQMGMGQGNASSPQVGMGQGNGTGQQMGAGRGFGLGQGYANNDYLKLNLDSIAITDLKEEEKTDLAYMIEEEKMARDIYILLYDKWKTKSFNNISQSEQIHMDAIKMLLDRHKLENPISDQKGVFKNPKIQELYNTLSKEGLESLEKALNVGAKVEEVDIKDLSEKVAKSSSQDIQLVFDALMSASENHLRAFTKNLSMFFDKTYVPSYLSAEDYQKIVTK